MTVLDILNSVKKRFPNTDATEICQIVNELEKRFVGEIFSLCGLEVRTTPLNPEQDLNTPLLLENEHILIYVYYAYWALSVKEMDMDGANSFAGIFNERFVALAIYYRRKYLPTKNTLLSGGV